MMKYYLCVWGVLFMILSAFSQSDSTNRADTSYWNSGILTSVSFSQVSLTNWASGGNNSISVNSVAAMFANYKRRRHSWESSLDLAYGLVKQGKLAFVKSDDKINLVSKYGYQVVNKNEKWYFSSLVDFRTQFDRGYGPDNQDSLISNFLAPGYFLLGFGMDYKPSKVFSINYIPITGKFTIVNDERLASRGAFGVEPGKSFRAEMGSYLRIKYKDELIKNVSLDSRLELFSNYLENFGNIDINWQNLLAMKVNSLITVTYSTQLLYDDDVKIDIDNNGDGIVDESGPRMQFKSILGVGLSYRLGDKRQEE